MNDWDLKHWRLHCDVKLQQWHDSATTVAQFLRSAIVGVCDSECLPRIPRTFQDLAQLQLFRFLTSSREKCRRQIPKPQCPTLVRNSACMCYCCAGVMQR